MNKISRRQLCLFFACMAPAGKLLNLPATLSSHAGNGLIVSALLPILLQFLVIYAILKLSERTELSFLELTRNTIGKVGEKIVAVLFALYFLFSAIPLLLEHKSFVQSAFYDTLHAIVVFLPFFLFSVFACMKNVTAIGRSADLSLPIFALSYGALVALALLSSEFSALLPLGRTPVRALFRGSLSAISHFSDSAYLLLFLGHFRGDKKTTRRVLLSYAIGSLLLLFFLAVFYGEFQSISARQNFAIMKIGKYNRAITTLGRIDYFFSYALTVVLIFYAVIPLQLAVECLLSVFGEHRFSLSLAVNAVALLGVIFFNYRAEQLSLLTSGALVCLYLLFADAVPLLSLLFRRKRRA